MKKSSTENAEADLPDVAAMIQKAVYPHRTEGKEPGPEPNEGLYPCDGEEVVKCSGKADVDGNRCSKRFCQQGCSTHLSMSDPFLSFFCSECDRIFCVDCMGAEVCSFNGCEVCPACCEDQQDCGIIYCTDCKYLHDQHCVPCKGKEKC
jgi:hypothetical protein